MKIRIDIPNFHDVKEAPKATRSMHAALETLRLSHLWVIYPGKHKYPVHEKITVWPLRDISSLPDQID
jgi:hypothetical protein